MKKVLSIVLCMVLVLSLAACGGSGSKLPADRVGTYSFYEMTSEGETISKDMLASLGMDEMFSMELKADGTGSMTVYDEAGNITWDEKTIKDEGTGENIEYTFEGGKITMTTEDGDVLVFQKK